MIRSKRKLALNTQTVAVLSSDELRSVNGGVIRTTKTRPPGSQCSYEESGCINETKAAG